MSLLMLEESIADARKRAAWALENARKAATLASGGSLAPPSGNNGVNILGLKDDVARGEELARHFTGWVYSSVRPIAQRIAGQPMRVARIKKIDPKGKVKRSDRLSRALTFARMPACVGKSYEMGHDVEVLEDHELLRALNDPNALMVRWVLIYVTVVALNMMGRAYWAMIPRDEADVKDGAPEFEIWPIPATWVTPNADRSKRGPYASWTVKPPGSTEGFTVPADDMVYFYYPDFNNPFGSFAPLDAVGTAVKTSEMMGQAQLSQFKHGMNPSWILTVGKDAQVPGMAGTGPRITLTQTQRQQIVHFIRQHYRGFHRNHEPLILDSLIESAVKASHSPAEMDYYNSAALPKEQITQGFGTNPIIMGQIEGANRATAAAADDHFCGNTVNPQIALISETGTAWMGPKFGKPGERLVFYIEPASGIDPDHELKKILAVFDRGGVDVDFLRSRLLGLPPVAGGHIAMVNPQLIPYEVIPYDEAEGDYNPYMEGPSAALAGQGAGGSQNQSGSNGGKPSDPSGTSDNADANEGK